MNKKTKPAAVSYKEFIANRQPEIIEVKAPSGFVFKRVKPSNFAILFEAGELPIAAAAEAAESWAAQGISIAESDETQSQQMTQKVMEEALAATERVYTNSVEPKIVKGKAQNNNEISWRDLDKDDLAYLYKYERSWGDPSVMAGMFPERPEPSVVARNIGAK